MNGIETFSLGNNNSNSDELVKAYVGDNYEILSKKSYNFSALIFTYEYLFYRKMDIYSLLTVIVYGIVLFLFPIPLVNKNIVVDDIMMNSIINLVAQFIIRIFWCLNFNRIYMNNANKNIEKIKNKLQESDFHTVIKKIKKAGGVSISGVILGPIIISFIITVVQILSYRV